MADEIKKISVRIGGMSYQLVSAEDEKYTRQIAARADEMIRRVMEHNPQLSQHMAAILALVNNLDDQARIRQQSALLDEQRQQAERQLADVRAELARLREQNWEMKKEVLRLTNLCHDYEALLANAAPAEQTAPADNPAAQLTQTNLDDYLRENGWPQPVEPRRYDD